MSDVKDLVWIERFRPKSVQECILPDRIKNNLLKMSENGNIQNYTAIGSAGSGKTSSARALCEQLGIDYILINMSNESGIDTVRNKIVNFASTMSFSSAYKTIILDEADHSSKSAQASLRGIIEEFASSCRFIITANFKNGIIEPLYSRCPILEFNFSNEERSAMLIQFIKRVEYILEQDSIQYDRTELITYCKQNFPDFRGILNSLQLNSSHGELNISGLGSESAAQLNELIGYLKSKSFDKCREWIVNNIKSNNTASVRRALYTRMKEFIQADSIPEFILLINQYDFKEASVVDKEINFLAFLVETMMNIEFK